MKRLFKLLLINVLFLSNCGSEPLFDYLAESNIQIVVKGTYASTTPRTWITSAATPFPSGSIENATAATNTNKPTSFMLDIAELRLDGDKFALFRETYQTAVNDESDPFFDGTGLPYECDRLFNGTTYNNLQIYLRKMIFNNAMQFDTSWANGTLCEEIFRERDVFGYDFNQKQNYTHYMDETNLKTNIIFPVNVNLDKPFTYDADKNYILEIRIIIKNYVKKYQYKDITNDIYYTYHGISDWNREINFNDTYRGGNLFAAVHIYDADRAVTLDSSTVAQLPSVSNTYVVAIPYNLDDTIADISDYIMTKPVRPGVDYASNPTQWDTFNDAANLASSKKIPPIVTYVTSGAYTMSGFEKGKRYSIYTLSHPGDGNMPVSFGVTPTNIIINEDGTVSNI